MALLLQPVAEDALIDMMAKILSPEGRDLAEATYQYDNKCVREDTEKLTPDRTSSDLKK
jgi:hypothetical protein